MSLDPILVVEVPLRRKATKSRLRRGDSDSSTHTTASESSRDMATQTAEPITATTHSDQINFARMSGGASSDKRSVTFDTTTTSIVSYRAKSRIEADRFVYDKRGQSGKPKRPTLKRSLSSLWRLLDPPELAHNSGVLHNLVKADGDVHKSWQGAENTTLVETISSRQYKQR